MVIGVTDFWQKKETNYLYLAEILVGRTRRSASGEQVGNQKGFTGMGGGDGVFCSVLFFFFPLQNLAELIGSVW